MPTPFDQGFDLYQHEPDLILAAVWWRMPRDLMPLPEQQEFVMGYITARAQHDAFMREQTDED